MVEFCEFHDIHDSKVESLNFNVFKVFGMDFLEFHDFHYSGIEYFNCSEFLDSAAGL